MKSQLQQAIERGNLQAVIAVLDSGADIEECDMHGDSGLPLRIACFNGHAAIVAELLKRGANPHAPNTDGAGAPIRIATRWQHLDIVGQLIAHGAEMPATPTATRPRVADRRQRGDRRKFNFGPPRGMKERRSQQERRVTLVRDVELSEAQWSTYFSRSNVERPYRNEAVEAASLVFDRVRD